MDEPFWSLPAPEVLARLRTSPRGLSQDEARRRLGRRPALGAPPRGVRAWQLALHQFTTPIVLLLLFAAGLSLVLGDVADAAIIFSIILVSGLLGFWQEWSASDAVARLLASVHVTATVLRDGAPVDVPVEQVVEGDVVLLNAGDVIPGDALILECNAFFVNEAALTGETFPVEKSPGTAGAATPFAQRSNVVFLGTHVASGTATALVAATGAATEFGRVSARLRLRAPETEFERGVRRFGYLLLSTTLLLVITIFAINVYLARPALQSLLFALALAVGLTPQLLPAIISVNLAHGARRMAAERVIVRRLAAIENFGSMDVLCADKTGTVTEGRVRVHEGLDPRGAHSARVLRAAYLNAVFQAGFSNPIDQAICESCASDVSAVAKLDEVPYDFVRKRLSVLVADGRTHNLITKGALPNVLDICVQAEGPSGEPVALDPAMRRMLQRQFEDLGAQGYRVLGVAVRDLGAQSHAGRGDEREMTFTGLLVLFDPPKAGVAELLRALRGQGIVLKMVTGDNRFVAAAIGRAVGLTGDLLTGGDLTRMSDEALLHRVGTVDIFAEIEPNQKERIILALRKAGRVVGYLGDGINDASALHAADVGISVSEAVDVAKEAADIVLLEKDLGVLASGVREGRTTFANTLKYVFMATSANFGNMFSMAGASLFLPFLPLLPTQILLMNFLTDLPEMAIATDRVDPELTSRPRRWDVAFIRRFMIAFGLISSVFDYVTFGVLLLLLRAGMPQFRSGWFVESVVSASLVVLVIRTRRSFTRSRPARPLLLATVVVAGVAFLLPFTALGQVFGFRPLPGLFLTAMAIIVGLYVLSAEAAKRLFYAWEVRP